MNQILNKISYTVYVFAFILVTAGSCFGSSEVDSVKSHTQYCVFGWELIQDESFDANYSFANFGLSEHGYHTVYGGWRPSVGYGHKSKYRLKNIVINWDKTIGFQYASQTYWGRYKEEIIDTNGGPPTLIGPEYKDKINKYYVFLRTGIEIMVGQRFYITPTMQLDYRIVTKVDKGPLGLALWGVYEPQTNELTGHKTINYKAGALIGYKINSSTDIRISYLRGLNESILVEQGDPWRNTQRTVSITYQIN